MPARPAVTSPTAPILPAEAYRSETRRIFVRRLDLTVALYLLLVGSSVLLEVALHHERARAAAVSYGIQALLCLAALVLVRRPVSKERPAVLAAALGGALAVVLSGYNAWVGGSVERFATAEVCLLSGLFVLLPWGWRAQLAVAVVALASIGLQAGAPGQAEPLAYGIVALVTGTITSVSGAFFLERYRQEAFVRMALVTQSSELARDEAETATALVRVSETLNAHLHDPEMLASVAQLGAEVLGTDWCTIFIWDEQREAFRFHAHAGMRDEVAAELHEIDFTRTSLPLVSALRPGVLIEMPNAVFETLIPPHLLQRWGVASMLVAPISRRDEVIGTLSFGYHTRTGGFSERQHRLALGSAHAAAIALENARLIADLQAASRLKSNFVATMSHELRTPLNVVTGYADLLAEGTFGPLSSEQRDTVTRIHQSALELLELVNATLDLGRLESGREPVHLIPFEVDALLAELDREMSAVVPPHVSLTWESRTGAAPVVTDRGKVKTILKNLVGNALKVTPKGSVTVTASATGETLSFTVADTGIGIAAADVPAIFEMFRQLDGSSTRRFGGVGLGLHIVRRLVDLLGGGVTVDSTPGVGSTFHVTLRVGRGATAAPAEAAPALSAPARANSGGTRARS